MQTIDFDPDTEPIRVLVTAKAAEIEAQKVKQRIEDEAILREKVKKQRAELAAQRAREEEEEKKRREVYIFNFYCYILFLFEIINLIFKS